MDINSEKTAIIGAGASGLAAAVAQARLGRKVTVFEHKDRAGLKLALTGNGKCNFTNAYMNASCFHEPEDSRLRSFLDRFTAEDALSFIQSIGVGISCRSGYYYPDTYKAETVVEALLKECRREGVEIFFCVEITDINDLIRSYDRVIMACGSRAHKETGSNGMGYRMLEHLGVPYTRVLPALCPLYCAEESFMRENKGKRAMAEISCGGQSAAGEIQITDYGISGIPVFNISRYVSSILDRGEEAHVNVNFDPDVSHLPEIIRNRANTNIYKPVTGIRSDSTIDLRIVKSASFDRSQVCTGGVSLDELTDDFELIRVPGVYVIGEMCDVDGICGGYNLHWAWLSGNLCAK